MPFLQNDLYLASGTSQLVNTWTDPVYKFDSSSFYNWEQDNLPIYDLEERDDLTWEMAGYPTSSVQGMMLTVSDCGIDNKKVFGSLEDVVSALPNTIRFPIIVEVATSGPLGSLRLDNLQFEGAGAGLEIINRGFAKAFCGSTTPLSTYETLGTNSSSITTFSSVDLSTTMYESSALGVSNTVWESNSDAAAWWSNYTRAFILTPEWSKNAAASNRTITISSKFKDSAGDFMGTDSVYNVDIYEDNSVSSDVTITNEVDSTTVLRASLAVADNDTRAIGMVYANALTNVYINDCNGKVYLRGFCVDGGSQASLLSEGTQRTEKGFEINNSNVVLENCTAARCSVAGLEAVNSNIILNRGFIAFHNYGLTTGVGGVNLSDKEPQETPGLRAISSNITLSATTADNTGLPIDAPFCFYRNKVGVELINSNLKTPLKQTYSRNVEGTSITENNGSQTIVLQSFFNLLDGIRAKDSVVNIGQRVSSFQNNIGVRLDNSVFNIYQITADHNQEAGLKSANSTFNYNKDAIAFGLTAGPFYPQTTFYRNGQHVLLSKSRFVPTPVVNMDTVYTRLAFKENFAVNEFLSSSVRKQTLPAVVVDDGSYMRAVASKSQCYNAADDDSGKISFHRALKGFAFKVTDQSTLELEGHQNDNTFILGPGPSIQQQVLAGIYAGDQSKVYVAGPTTIAQYGVGALAENESVVAFGPHLVDGYFNVSGFNLADTDNHTKVQVHSTRAGLVANKNSQIIMKDMGDFNTRWANKYKKDLDGVSTDTDYTTSTALATYYGSNRTFDQAYCVSGSMNFYANPYAFYGTGGNQLNLVDQATPINVTNMAADTERGWENIAISDLSTVSYGGMCVRAVDNSEVEVRNVNFPVNWTNASGAYYDASASECELLKIWNIADTSKLKVAFTSVNGVHPQEVSASYYGPSAVWVSGGSWTPVSGCPSSTPTTSGLSVLDSFGKGVDTVGEAGFYGKTNFENVGPFRLYVSPTPKAKFLGYPYNADGYFAPAVPPAAVYSMGFDFIATGIDIGAPYQVISQGYNPSGDCSASYIETVSSIYNDLAFSGYIMTLPTPQQLNNDGSSFYYTSSMLDVEENNIWLDESGMNLFANAKNGTLSSSGRKKFVNYYAAATTYPGEAWWRPDIGKGIGSINLFDLERNL
jgi:hypothetical protein